MVNINKARTHALLDLSQFILLAQELRAILGCPDYKLSKRDVREILLEAEHFLHHVQVIIAGQRVRSYGQLDSG